MLDSTHTQVTEHILSKGKPSTYKINIYDIVRQDHVDIFDKIRSDTDDYLELSHTAATYNSIGILQYMKDNNLPIVNNIIDLGVESLNYDVVKWGYDNGFMHDYPIIDYNDVRIKPILDIVSNTYVLDTI